MEQTPTPQRALRRKFYKKFSRNVLIGLIIIVFSLGIGMMGYSYFEKMSLVDAYVNAAMILSGMGPVSTLETTGGKIFAGSYALFSGIIFLIVMAFILVPVFHHLFHPLHMEEETKVITKRKPL